MNDYNYEDDDTIASVDYLNPDGSYTEVSDELNFFAEQLVRLGFDDVGIAACIAGQLGVSELSVSVGYDVGPANERLVFVWVRVAD